MKYHLITLGCQMNMSDSERVRTMIETQTGYQWTDKEEEANLLGILACSVRQKAIDKVYSRIQRWNKWKNRKSLITFISGCILPDDMQKFLKLFDIIFRMSELEVLPDMIRQYGVVTPASLVSDLSGMPKNESIDSFWNVTPRYSSDFEAFIWGGEDYATYVECEHGWLFDIARIDAEFSIGLGSNFSLTGGLTLQDMVWVKGEGYCEEGGLTEICVGFEVTF